jgi:hypothetical protein
MLSVTIPSIVSNTNTSVLLGVQNSNMQNWRLNIARGSARNRVVNALKNAIQEGDPKIPPLPNGFQHYRSEFGH